MAYDPIKPCMNIGTAYPNMKELRLAMKPFAINDEFELCLIKTDWKRYIADCNANGYRWHINGEHNLMGQHLRCILLANNFPFL